MTRTDAIAEETRRYVSAVERVSMHTHWDSPDLVAKWRHRAHIHWLALVRLRNQPTALAYLLDD